MQVLKQTIPLVILSLLTTGLLPVLSQAERMPSRGPLPFHLMDRDSDGFISAEEFNLTRAERMAQRSAEGRMMRNAVNAPTFNSFDSNADGQLSQEEFMAGHKIRMQQRRQQQMQNQPVINQRQPALEYADVDLDSNGSISVSEFNQAKNRMLKAHQRQHSTLSNPHDFSDIDADGNGVIDPGEFRAHQLQH